MNENAIRKNIRRLLFEDNWVSLATADKSAGKFVVDSDEEAPVPVTPMPQTAAQVSVDAPPVDDEQYIPSSSIDLAKALYELFKDAPPSQIEWVYTNAHRLRGEAESRGKHFRVSEPAIDDTVPLKKPVRKSTKNPKRV
tara:strand:- start:52 stop:468 length:417 start_codon:yes stop_codon:yes gene_type:complete